MHVYDVFETYGYQIALKCDGSKDSALRMKSFSANFGCFLRRREQGRRHVSICKHEPAGGDATLWSTVNRDL
jgi:hypothetical protein